MRAPSRRASAGLPRGYEQFPDEPTGQTANGGTAQRGAI